MTNKNRFKKNTQSEQKRKILLKLKKNEEIRTDWKNRMVRKDGEEKKIT